MTVTDILTLATGFVSLPLGVFCFVLARRLRKLNNLETGLGGAIAVLASEIERLEKSIKKAQAEATRSTLTLNQAIEKAKSEKAYWVLQTEITKGANDASNAPRRLRRKTALREVRDA